MQNTLSVANQTEPWEAGLDGALPAPAWFCVRTHPKREAAAAAQLRCDLEIDVFLPLVRFKRTLGSRAVWITEALFQNYIFARFELSSLRRVRHARAVRGVVHFGDRYPTVPGEIIEDLRAKAGVEGVQVIGETLSVGDEVRIAGGPFHDLEAVVARAGEGQPQRVALLLEFLGRQTMVEMSSEQLTPVGRPGVEWA